MWEFIRNHIFEIIIAFAVNLMGYLGKQEHARLKRIVAELTLEKAMLKVVASGNF